MNEQGKPWNGTLERGDYELSGAVLNRNHDQAADATCGDVALLIPDGVGLRNFVLGPFLRQCPEQSRIDAFHIIPESNLPKYLESLDRTVHWHHLVSDKDRPLPYLLRNCVGSAQLYWVDSFTARRHRNR